MSATGFMEYYRDVIQASWASEKRNVVRIRPPAEIVSIQVASGVTILADANGVFEVGEDDAQSFLEKGWVLAE